MLNLEGKRFAKLTVIRRTKERSCGAVVWLCKCDCGKTTKISTPNLKRGHTRSCGCLNLELKKVIKNGKVVYFITQKAAEKRYQKKGLKLLSKYKGIYYKHKTK